MKDKFCSLSGFASLLLVLLAVQSVLSQTNPRKFYKYDVVATNSASLTVGSGPSINDYGDVAFAGRITSGGGTVFLSEIGQPNVDLMPGLSGNPNQVVGGRVQLNNSRQVVQHTIVSSATGPQNFLRRINGVSDFTLLAVANAGTGFNDFAQIFPESIGINAFGEPVYTTRTGVSTPTLTTGIRPLFSTLQSPATGNVINPAINDLGEIALRIGSQLTDPIRLYEYDLSAFLPIASVNEGFTTLGQSPGISDFSEVIVFYGVLNQTGADALGTNPGPGIFASIEINKTTFQRRIVRIAGRLIENNAAPGGNDDGYCDPGETCIQGELGFNKAGSPIFFNSFDFFNRVGIAHQSVGAAGIEDDIFVVSFLGTPNIANDNPERPFSNQTGLWTVTTQIKNEGGVMREKPSVAVPVAQIGDVINTRTVTSINVYDPIAGIRTPGSTTQSPGSHRLAFQVGTNSGDMILRAKRKVDVPVIFIPGVGGSVLAERSGSSFIERWPGGLNASNYPNLSLAPGEVRDIEALDAVRRIRFLGVPVENVYEEILTAMTTGAGGLTEYQVADVPGRRTVNGCDLTQTPAQPNLFIFAYDWRKSNATNTSALRDYIRCIQRFYPETDVDIVAHSMGGLLARRYILDNPSNHSVRKMVTIASPYVGAPRSVKVLEDGGFFEAWQSALTAIRGVRPTGANRIFKRLVPYFLGAHELMPSERYFDLGGNPFAERFDFNGDGVISSEGYNYPTIFNTFNARFSTLPYTNNSLFHTGPQDDWRNDTSGVEYYQLYGEQEGDETPEQIIAKPRARGARLFSNSNVRFEIRKGKGDGTVPVLSAKRIGNGIDLNGPLVPELFVPMQSSGETDENVEHNGLHQNARVQQRIFQILGLTSQSVVGSASHQGKEENEVSDEGKLTKRESNYLTIEGVEVLRITDELGRTNVPLNEDFELAVPEVSYESVYIDAQPEGWYMHDLGLTTLHQYTVKFRTGNDLVDIQLVKGIGNASPNLAIRYLDLQLPTNVECLLTVNAQGMEDLRYDSNGDGTYDVVVPAHVRVTGSAAQDVTAPNVLIDVGPKQGSSRLVTITATDAQSGVGTTYYRIGESGNFQVYTGPFYVSVLAGVVEAFADDNVGNRSSPVRAEVPR